MKASELKQIIREEIGKVINENLTITDWDEFRNPDHLLLTLSNGKQLKIAKQQIKGGRAAYESIITLLDNMESNPKAKEAMLKLVNAMASNLTRESVNLKEYDRNVTATEWAKWPNTKHGDILLSKRTGVLAVRDGNVLRPIFGDPKGGGYIVHDGAYATDKRFTTQVKPDINSIAKAYQSLWSRVTDEDAKKYATAVVKEIKKLLMKK